MNANIMKTHIFYKMKYDLKGHIRSNKAFYVYLFSSNNSSVKGRDGSLFALWMWRRKLRLSMILKLGLMKPLLSYEEIARFKIMFLSFDPITTLTYVIIDNFCSCFFYKMRKGKSS